MSRTLPILLLATGCMPMAETVDRTDLADLLGVESSDVTGLSTEPGTEALILVESDGTLWRVADGEPEVLLDGGAVNAAGFSGEVSDVAAMGDGRYALTVPNLGLKFDTSDGSLVDWFCYLPDSFGDWTIQTQHTNALAWDPETEHLVSQPQTLEDGEPIRSDLAEFDGMLGGDLSWYPMKNEAFFASAVAVKSGGVQLVADGVVYEHAYGSDDPQPMAHVPADRVEGMTWWNDELVIVDADTQELITIRY